MIFEQIKTGADLGRAGRTFILILEFYTNLAYATWFLYQFEERKLCKDVVVWRFWSRKHIQA